MSVYGFTVTGHISFFHLVKSDEGNEEDAYKSGCPS